MDSKTIDNKQSKAAPFVGLDLIPLVLSHLIFPQYIQSIGYQLVMMQAIFQKIDTCELLKKTQVEIISSYPQIQICCDSLRRNSKYKKVTLEERLQLLALVSKGLTIIKAAKLLKINYSTAKSIFQNLKVLTAGKKRRRKLIQSSCQLDISCVDGQWSNYPTKFK